MPSYTSPGPKFKLKLKCNDCGHRYFRIVTSVDEPDPDCPRCLKAQRLPRGMDFSKPPPGVGGTNLGRAHDFAESEAARQAGLTNLRTPRRAGDVSSPALPPAQQAQADSFFSQGGKVAKDNPALAARTSAATAAVNAGAFTQNEDARFVSKALGAGRKANVHYINAPPVQHSRRG